MTTLAPLAFSDAEYRQRLLAVRSRMEAAGLEALLVNKPENMFYLSGYETHGFFWFQVLVVTLDKEPFFIVRTPEASNIRHTSIYQTYIGYADYESPIKPVAAFLQEYSRCNVGIEMNSWFITPAQYTQLSAASPNVNFVDASDLVDAIRVVKSSAEIEYVIAAAKIADAAVRAGIESIANAKSDLDINAAVVSAMILAGGEYPALWPFVTNGAATERFHVSWSNSPLHAGDLVYMHIPGVVRRYLAGVGRTGARGPIAPKLRDRYRLLCEAQAEGVARLRPGITAAEAYAGFAAPVERAGFKLLQGGYAIGINFPPRWAEWERLRLNKGCDTVLAPGMVFHTPLSIREPNEQTPLISNTVLITDAGADVLTKHSTELHTY